jgi:hypothetical protein
MGEELLGITALVRFKRARENAYVQQGVDFENKYKRNDIGKAID